MQQKKERMKRKEDSLIDLWDNVKCAIISIIGPPKRRERETKNLRKHLKKKWLKSSLTGENKHSSPGSTEILHSINPGRRIPRHIVIKLTKIF